VQRTDGRVPFLVDHPQDFKTPGQRDDGARRHSSPLCLPVPLPNGAIADPSTVLFSCRQNLAKPDCDKLCRILRSVPRVDAPYGLSSLFIAGYTSYTLALCHRTVMLP
jgi:hypothetical protein